MCDLCKAAGVNNPPMADQESGDLDMSRIVKRNEDGTFTLTLTGEQMRNLVVRLAMGQIMMGASG